MGVSRNQCSPPPSIDPKTLHNRSKQRLKMGSFEILSSSLQGRKFLCASVEDATLFGAVPSSVSVLLCPKFCLCFAYFLPLSQLFPLLFAGWIGVEKSEGPNTCWRDRRGEHQRDHTRAMAHGGDVNGGAWSELDSQNSQCSIQSGAWDCTVGGAPRGPFDDVRSETAAEVQALSLDASSAAEFGRASLLVFAAQRNYISLHHITSRYITNSVYITRRRFITLHHQ
jgi:hypothetical protein